jgi:PKD repeat protein
VDMFFGPYNDTSALYVVSYSASSKKRIWRIRFTDSMNRSPVASVVVSNTTVSIGQVVSFDGSQSIEPDGDALTFAWDFGDGKATNISNKSNVDYVYSSPGVFNVKFTVTDTKDQFDQSTISISVGAPPKATMLSPQAGKKFFVGETILLRGSAKDWVGSALSPSQLFWEVRKHHATHWHPFLDRKAGNNFTLSPAPEPEDLTAATNSYLEVIMYAVDSRGLTTTVSRMIMPMLRQVAVKSVPSGLKVLIDEFPVVTPTNLTTWARHKLRLDVVDQPPYIFKSWSNGGARKKTKYINTANGTLTTVSVTFTQVSLAPPFKLPVRDCSSQNRCGRCEGHCADSTECQSGLVCYNKGGKSLPVRGCTGIDGSLTKWCTIPKV